MEEEPGVLSFQSMGRRRRTTTTTTTTTRRFDLGCMGSIRIVGGCCIRNFCRQLMQRDSEGFLFFGVLFCGLQLALLCSSRLAVAWCLKKNCYYAIVEDDAEEEEVGGVLGCGWTGVLGGRPAAEAAEAASKKLAIACMT
jgi:hypothetical protein